MGCGNNPVDTLYQEIPAPSGWSTNAYDYPVLLTLTHQTAEIGYSDCVEVATLEVVADTVYHPYSVWFKVLGQFNAMNGWHFWWLSDNMIVPPTGTVIKGLPVSVAFYDIGTDIQWEFTISAYCTATNPNEVVLYISQPAYYIP